MASSRRSSRSFALRELSSGPWQLKHLPEMIGRIWELKSTGSRAGWVLGPANAAAAVAAHRVRAASRAEINIRRFIQSVRTRFGNGLFFLYRIKPAKPRTDKGGSEGEQRHQDEQPDRRPGGDNGQLDLLAC